MTQHEHQELREAANELIERTRRALSPREADQARVLAALSERLFQPQIRPQTGSGAEGSASSRLIHAALPPPTAPQIAQTASKLRGLWGWTIKGVLPLVTVAALGLLWMTPRLHREKKATRRDIQPHVSASVSSSLTPAAVKNGVELLAHERAQATESRSDSPALVPSKPEKKRAPRKRCHAADGSERPCPSPTATPTALAASPAPAQTSLRLELDALRKAERALRERQPARALEVLEAFERVAAGDGAMKEERSAASTVARCALPPQNGQALYDAFVRRYPSSAYAARVRQTCLHKP